MAHLARLKLSSAYALAVVFLATTACNPSDTEEPSDAASATDAAGLADGAPPSDAGGDTYRESSSDGDASDVGVPSFDDALARDASPDRVSDAPVGDVPPHDDGSESSTSTVDARVDR